MSSLCQVIRRAIQLRGNHVATRFAERERTWEEIGGRVARLGGRCERLA